MCRLFETIKVVNGMPQHLTWHEDRMNRARREIWPTEKPVVLQPLLVVPQEFSEGQVRCNILYGPGIQNIKFKTYESRIIRSLKLVKCDAIDYHLKFTERFLFESLMTLRGECDEIIIVKNGLLTDTSISNIIFCEGKNWVTPAKPLLKGTCRERLIAEERIIEQDIRPEDIIKFEGCKIINALRDPCEEMMIPVSRIYQ